MHKLETVLENERHKILWDLEIQTDHSIPARIAQLAGAVEYTDCTSAEG